jgi:hypothetical protein
VAGFLVAVKQISPEQEIPTLKLRAKVSDYVLESVFV